MQIIRASELFNNMGNINNMEFENSKSITLDFSNIESIDLKAVTTLLNIQKVALLNNKSLLAKGVIGVNGKFQAGDIVSIINNDKEIAKGKIRYSISDISKIMGAASSEIYNILGYKVSDEIIHKDDLLII